MCPSVGTEGETQPQCQWGYHQLYTGSRVHGVYLTGLGPSCLQGAIGPIMVLGGGDVKEVLVAEALASSAAE